jgi:hypothetical protein
MNATLGWALAAAALVGGYLSYGWKGLVLGLTVIVFWLLLQFSRSLRALRDASARPVATVDNAVMLHAKVQPGMRLVDVLKLTRSLGRRTAEVPETFVWADAGGDEVQVMLTGGRVTEARLVRTGAPVSSPERSPGA